MVHLLLYVRYANGSSYCRAQLRADEPDALRRLDREAWHWLARPGVVSVELRKEAGRVAGYRR